VDAMTRPSPFSQRAGPADGVLNQVFFSGSLIFWPTFRWFQLTPGFDRLEIIEGNAIGSRNLPSGVAALDDVFARTRHSRRALGAFRHGVTFHRFLKLWRSRLLVAKLAGHARKRVVCLLRDRVDP